MKSIILLNQTFYPDPSATGQYLEDLSMRLKESNYSVKVFASKNDYSNPTVQYASRELYRGIGIRRFGQGGRYEGNALLRFTMSIVFSVKMTFTLLVDEKPNAVLVTTSPPFLASLVAFVCAFRKIRFIYWVMDLNPDQVVAAGWLGEKSFAYWIADRFHRFALNQAERIIVMDRDMKRRLRTRLRNYEKIKILPPWNLFDSMTGVNKDKGFRKTYHLEDKLIIMYAGNMSLCHPLDTILEVARALRDHDDIHFAFVGGGVRKKEVINFKEKYQLNNIGVYPYQAREDLDGLLTSADLHLVVMGEPYLGIVHPCKLYNILMTDRPVAYIGPNHSYAGQLLRHFNLGTPIQLGDEIALKNLILSIERERGLLDSDLEGRRKWRAIYQKSRMLDKMVTWIDEIVEGRLVL